MSNNTSIVRYDLEKGQNSVVNPHIEEPETKQSWVTALPGLINTAANITSSLSQGSGKGKDLSSLNKAIDDLITMREQGIPQEQMVLAEKETTASLLKQGFTYTDIDAGYKFKGYEGYADISRKALQEESNIVAAQDTIASQVGAGLIGPGATLKEQRQAGLDYLANLDKSLATTEEIKNAQGQEAKAEAVNNNLRVLYKNAADTASIVLNKQGYSLDNYIAVKQQWCADLVQKTGIEMQAAYTIFDRATFNTKSVVTSNIQSVEEMDKAIATANSLTMNRKFQSFLSMPLAYVNPVTNEKTITDGATFLTVSEKIPLESLKVLMGVPMGQELLTNLLSAGTVSGEFAPAMYQNLATTGQAWSIGSNPTMTNNIVNSFTVGQEQIAKEAATASTNELLSNAGIVSVDKFNTLFNNISKEQINSKDYEGVLQQREQIRNKAVVAATTSLGKITKGAATLIDEFGNVRLFSGDTEGNLVDITDKKEDFFNVGGTISSKAFDGTVAGIRMMSYNMQKLGYSQEEFRDFFNTMSAISSQDFRVAKAGRGNPFLGGEDNGSVLSIDEARQFVKEALSGKKTVNLNALYDSPKEKGLNYLTESFEEESNKQMNRALAEGPNRVTQEDIEDLPEDDGVVTTDTADFLAPTEYSESYDQVSAFAPNVKDPLEDSFIKTEAGSKEYEKTPENIYQTRRVTNGEEFFRLHDSVGHPTIAGLDLTTGETKLFEEAGVPVEDLKKKYDNAIKAVEKINEQEIKETGKAKTTLDTYLKDNPIEVEGDTIRKAIRKVINKSREYIDKEMLRYLKMKGTKKEDVKKFYKAFKNNKALENVLTLANINGTAMVSWGDSTMMNRAARYIKTGKKEYAESIKRQVQQMKTLRNRSDIAEFINQI